MSPAGTPSLVNSSRRLGMGIEGEFMHVESWHEIGFSCEAVIGLVSTESALFPLERREISLQGLDFRGDVATNKGQCCRPLFFAMDEAVSGCKNIGKCSFGRGH